MRAQLLYTLLNMGLWLYLAACFMWLAINSYISSGLIGATAPVIGMVYVTILGVVGARPIQAGGEL
jgi:hypothetical protein